MRKAIYDHASFGLRSPLWGAALREASGLARRVVSSQSIRALTSATVSALRTGRDRLERLRGGTGISAGRWVLIGLCQSIRVLLPVAAVVRLRSCLGSPGREPD